MALAIVWGLALVLAVLAYRRHDRSFEGGLLQAADQLVRVMPRILMALLAAGFIAKLIPGDLVGEWIGPGSGARGLIIAALAGVLVPAGPVVAFSLAAVLAQSGAAPPQLVAFVTSWCIFAMHRITIYEIPMLGWRFLALRLGAGAVLPLLAGLIAGAILLIPGLDGG